MLSSAPVRLTFAVAVLLSVPSWPQTKPSPESKSTAKLSKPKLTPDQQHGLRLLKASEGEAAGLEPEMRAFVLWQMSSGYVKEDPAKTHALLRKAFDATHNIEESAGARQNCRSFSDPCHVKVWLQEQILYQILKTSPDGVRNLLPHAQRDARDDVTKSLIAYYAEHKNFNAAKEILDQFSADKDYPYFAAEELMLVLPAELSADRLAIFSQALNNYLQYSTDSGPGLADFSTMVVRFWRDLPPAIVLDAIDAILNRAKDSDKYSNQVKVSIYAEKSDINFSNVYQLRLFELLPMIAVLDEPEAESLLRDNAEAAALLNRNPMGLQSVAKLASRGSSVQDVLADGIHSMSYSQDSKQAALDLARNRQQEELNRRTNEIEAAVRDNPQQALTEAMSLPLVGPFEYDSPRLGCLSAIAAKAAKNAPSVARSALEEQSKALDSAPPAAQATVIIDMTKNYLALNDEDAARKSIKQAFKVAETLYAVDSGVDDPNAAFKGFWPSTALWGATLKQALRISPTFAEEIISEIRDPDIATMERVFYANSLLGVTNANLQIVSAHSKGTRVSAERD
jgi:hypothetical protein